MCLITAAEFLANPMKYLQLAKNETVSVQDDNLFFDITYRKEEYENPSPSGDTWWDIPENYAMVKEAIAHSKEPNAKFITLEELKQKYNL